MIHRYQTVYHAENSYELPVRQAVYQLLVLPETSNHQQLLEYHVKSSIEHEWWTAMNAFGAACIMIAPQFPIEKIEFEVR